MVGRDALAGMEEHMRVSRTGIIISAAPGLLALALFYSLAIHMYQSFGAWPSGIGERGFPAALSTHAAVATNYFWVTLVLSIFLLPVAILVCLFVSRWRRFVPYFALYAFVFIISIAIMHCAPEPFLYWWRD
jgi:hypothetical protein